eukprot:TRINITY_DN67_c0_g1_i4.p2 TRINITY_DN67_c0_g1~~TRINITY_DN67_c0_g1_i4.p2  ORF type:complete len:185 (+),score=2.80 TRINITY_DN67_c0_g1_i4:371-925(+)
MCQIDICYGQINKVLDNTMKLDFLSMDFQCLQSFSSLFFPITYAYLYHIYRRVWIQRIRLQSIFGRMRLILQKYEFFQPKLKFFQLCANLFVKAMVDCVRIISLFYLIVMVVKLTQVVKTSVYLKTVNVVSIHCLESTKSFLLISCKSLHLLTYVEKKKKKKKDRKSTRLNSSHEIPSRIPASA